MGQTSSFPSNHWHSRLVFASHATSLSNNVVTCPELGLIYRITTPRSLGTFFSGSGFTSIFRRDPYTQEDILIAEIEKLNLPQTRVRFATQGGSLKSGGNRSELNGVPFVTLDNFLVPIGKWSGSKRTFRASNSLSYVWRERSEILQLFPSEDKYMPIAEFSAEDLVSSSPMHIKLAHGSEQIVDEILVTGMIMEKKRRYEAQSAAAEAVGGAAGAG